MSFKKPSRGKMKLVGIILDKMEKISKSQKKMIAMVMRMMTTIMGRVNFESLSRFSGKSEKTFRRWFEKKFDFAEFNMLAIQQLYPSIPAEQRTEVEKNVFSFDGCVYKKAGKKTYGVDNQWDSCESKTCKGIEISVLAMNPVCSKTAYPLIGQQTIPAEEIKKLLNDSEATRIDFYIEIINKNQHHIKKFSRTIVCDGAFAKKKFVDAMVVFGLDFVGKLRIDANLKKVYVPEKNSEQKKKRGRPRKYGNKCNTATLEGFTFAHNFAPGKDLYDGIFYHSALQRNIKVVACVSTNNDKKTVVALLFSTNVKTPALLIHEYYSSRFHIEFIFRDAQQFTGFAHCQSRKKESINFHANASLAAINLTKIDERLKTNNPHNPQPFSMASHKIKNYNENLLNTFFSKFKLDLNLIKSNPSYQQILNYGTITPRAP